MVEILLWVWAGGGALYIGHIAWAWWGVRDELGEDLPAHELATRVVGFAVLWPAFFVYAFLLSANVVRLLGWAGVLWLRAAWRAAFYGGPMPELPPSAR